MFLGLLNKNEKIAFLQLAHHVARSDGDFSEKQKEIIANYCFEMQVDDISYNENEFDLVAVLKNFKSNKSKKIALLEIMALIYSDYYVHPEEKKIIDKMVEVFNFNKELALLYLEWTKAMLALYKQGELFINV